MQSGILDGHADRAGDGDQEIKVIHLEPFSVILGIDLEDADGPSLLIP